MSGLPWWLTCCSDTLPCACPAASLTLSLSCLHACALQAARRHPAALVAHLLKHYPVPPVLSLPILFPPRLHSFSSLSS